MREVVAMLAAQCLFRFLLFRKMFVWHRLVQSAPFTGCSVSASNGEYIIHLGSRATGSDIVVSAPSVMSFSVRRTSLIVVRSLLTTISDVLLQAHSGQSPDLIPYARKISDLLQNQCQYPTGATRLYNHLYLSGMFEAMDHALVNRLGITHVINCASDDVDTNLKFYEGKTKVQKFVPIPAQDDDEYNIMQHFNEAYAAIEEARTTNGVALIHCQMGVNRSGALAVAYVMVFELCGPVTAVKQVLDARKYLLSNQEFQFQVVSFAKDRDMLKFESSHL